MATSSQTDIANRHDFTTTYTNEFDNSQDDAIITPATGKTLKIVGAQINVEGTVSSGYVRLYFSQDVDGNENTVAKVYAGSGVNHFDINPCLIRGAQNEPLKVEATTGAGGNYFLAVNYGTE